MLVFHTVLVGYSSPEIPRHCIHGRGLQRQPAHHRQEHHNCVAIQWRVGHLPTGRHLQSISSEFSEHIHYAIRRQSLPIDTNLIPRPPGGVEQNVSARLRRRPQVSPEE